MAITFSKPLAEVGESNVKRQTKVLVLFTRQVFIWFSPTDISEHITLFGVILPLRFTVLFFLHEVLLRYQAPAKVVGNVSMTTWLFMLLNFCHISLPQIP